MGLTKRNIPDSIIPDEGLSKPGFLLRTGASPHATRMARRSLKMTKHHNHHQDGHQLADALASVSDKIATVPESGFNRDETTFISSGSKGVLWRRRLLNLFQMQVALDGLLPEYGLTVDFESKEASVLFGIYKHNRDVCVCIVESTGSVRKLVVRHGLENTSVPLAAVLGMIAGTEPEGLDGAQLRLAELLADDYLKPLAERQEERHGAKHPARHVEVKAESAPKSERPVERDGKGLPKGYDTSSLKLLDANLSEYVGKFGNRRRFAYWNRAADGSVSCVYVEARLAEGDVALVCTGADGAFADPYREFRGTTIMQSRFVDLAHGTSDATSEPAERFAVEFGRMLVQLKDTLAAERAARQAERVKTADLAVAAS